MKPKKFKLEELNIKSFLTTEDRKQIKGAGGISVTDPTTPPMTTHSGGGVAECLIQ